VAQIVIPAKAVEAAHRARLEVDRMMRAGQAIEHGNRQGA
jgi:hypothetical protein